MYALDLIGDPGRSVHDGRRISWLGDLMDWLDGLMLHLGLGSASHCGHSYGGWLALNYALHAPQRVSKLALLDPTQCFAGLKLSYLLHAAPLMARPPPSTCAPSSDGRPAGPRSIPHGWRIRLRLEGYLGWPP